MDIHKSDISQIASQLFVRKENSTMDLNINILIVDDFPGMRGLIKGILKNMGFNNFFEAQDGAIALSLIEKEKIDLIISDWIMPNMTGLDLLKAIKGIERLKGIPFLIITADGSKENVLAAIEAGVSSYIVKPFTPETLQAKVQNVLKRRGK